MNGHKAIHYAADYGHADVSVLIQLKADLNVSDLNCTQSYVSLLDTLHG